jgi:maltokinase
MSALAELMQEWLPTQRWFGGKGRAWASVTEDGFLLDKADPVLSVHRIRITYVDGGREVYLVPLSWRDHSAEELSSALIGAVPSEGRETYAYDAMRDREATMAWLTHMVAGDTVGALHFHPTAVEEIPAGAPGDIVSTE